MQGKQVSMRKIKEILRLDNLGLSQRKIAVSVKVSRSTVKEYLTRALAADLNWEVAKNLSTSELLTKLNKETSKQSDSKNKLEPDYKYLHKEQKKKGVTLFLLWEEYNSETENSYSYSIFCSKYRTWKRANELSLRKPHQAGESCSVDYTGVKFKLRKKSEETKEVEIFVSCLECSNYIYAEATLSQSKKDWINSNRRALEFYGGSPKILIPDNLKSAVSKANYYEPGLNIDFESFALHYDIAVIPARARKPRDKGKVEAAVKTVEQRIVAPLRNQFFSTLAELNQAIKVKLEELNNRAMQGYDCSRKELFESIEKPALQALPKEPFIYKETKLAKVNIDYHVEYEKSYYSVPHQLRKETVEIHANDKVVEIYHNSERIACHSKASLPREQKTDSSHMPERHKAVSQVNRNWLISKSTKIGEETVKQITRIIDSRKHPEQGYRASLGIIRLADKYGSYEVEAACALANSSGVYSYKRISFILKNANVYKEENSSGSQPIKNHKNLRGSNYYKH